MTPYEQWQLEKYGNVIPEPEVNEDGSSESDSEKWDRYGDFITEQTERQYDTATTEILAN